MVSSSHYIPFYTIRLHCCYYLCIPLWGSEDRYRVSGEVGRHVICLVLDFNSISVQFVSIDLAIRYADSKVWNESSSLQIFLF